jgi:GntR family transcriptional regulator of vanillate catabolism
VKISGQGRLRSTAPASPASRVNLDDHVYDRLKAMIVDRSLLPGERIIPEQLARSMGLSRTPILSALKRLSQEQLVEWRSRRGVFVRRLSKRELALIFELREMLEGLAARRAAMVITPQQVEHFRGLFCDIRGPETPELRRTYMRQDYLFHSGLLEIAGSAPLTQTMRSVNILVSAFGAGLIRPMSEVMAEHETIFDVLMRRDPDAAEAAMRAHIKRSVEWLHHEAELAERSEADRVDRSLPMTLKLGGGTDHERIR